MKILVIDEEFPWPMDTGKRTRSLSLIAHLARGHEVAYLAYGDATGAEAEALRERGIEPIGVPPLDRRKEGPRFYLRLLLNLFSRWPYIVSSHHSARFERALRAAVDGGGYDVVIAEWSPYAIFLRGLRSVPTVVVAHNIEAGIWRRYEANEPNLLKRWYIGIQRRKVEAFERRCFGWADGATAVSAAEAREIGSYGVGYEVAVVDNGVDVDYFHPARRESDPDSLVFTGSMDWRPNQDAVEYFVKEIFPRVRERRPKATFTAVGRRPPRHVVDLGRRPGVAITGTVDDVRPYVERATLCVVPLRIGGGSRLKILEAMAMHRPVLSTSVGAEGLSVRDGEHLVLADDPQGFADAAVELLEDVERRQLIADAGRSLVESRYRWSSLGGRLEDYLDAVVARR